MSDSFTVSYDTISLLVPEIVLVITAAWIYLAGAFDDSRRWLSWFAITGLAFAAFGLWREASMAAAMYGPVGFDTFGYAVRWSSIAIAVLFVAAGSRTPDRGPAPEMLGSLLLAFSGLMLVAVSGELVLMFMGLELISIPTYLLLFVGRNNNASREATLKYFFLSILSSALLLYGFSFLYGLAGSTHLSVIATGFQSPPLAAATLGPVALMLIVAGLGFKLAIVPFHFYAPDVYEGTTNFNAGLLAVVPKVAGIVALVRLAGVMMPVIDHYGWQLCLVLSVLTMTVGNVVALWQSNVRRLMAYSSIAHAGYMLIGLAVWLAARRFEGSASLLPEVSQEGLAATLIYLAIYVVASIGTFAALIYLGREGHQIDDVDELAGLSKTHRLTALAIAAFMFSLAGIPPLAGFWGKLSLFASSLSVNVSEPAAAGVTVHTWFIVLAVVGVMNAAISAAYYLRVIATMYFRSPERVPRAEGGWGAALAAGVCVVLAVGIGLYPGPLLTCAQLAVPSAAIDSDAAAAVLPDQHQPSLVHTTAGDRD